MRFDLNFETDPEKVPLAEVHFKAHRTRIDEFHSRGTLLMVGPYESPMDGALAIFSRREAAEEFAREDSFVVNGVVDGPKILG
jgi:uncharacterized protein YciI